MNSVVVKELLEQWKELIEKSRKTSITKAEKTSGGLLGRIKRTTGKPVIFDFDSYAQQQDTQNILCRELPQWSDLIRSQPEIMDGYSWTRGDFIDLYYSHYKLVIEKLGRAIKQQSPM